MGLWPQKKNRPSGHAVRRKTRRISRRSRWIGSGAILGMALLAGVGILWAMRTPVFAVTRIESGSYRFTDSGDLDERLGTFLGRNIWTLHAREVHEALAELLWIRDLRVGRRLPGTLEVDFREWRPLALIGIEEEDPDTGTDRWVLAENGATIPFPEHLGPAVLPMILGVRPLPEGGLELLAWPDGDPSKLVELFLAIADAGLETVSPVDFVVVRPEGLGIVLQDGLGRLLVGREDFQERLERYMTARDHLEPGLEVDLRFTDRVTVRRPGSSATTSSSAP